MMEEKEKKIVTAVDQAVGNVKLENISVSHSEKSKVEDVLKRYSEQKSEAAVKSLLYDLVESTQKLEEGKLSHEKGK